jgi:hypothetical protein
MYGAHTDSTVRVENLILGKSFERLFQAFRVSQLAQWRQGCTDDMAAVSFVLVADVDKHGFLGGHVFFNRR